MKEEEKYIEIYGRRMITKKDKTNYQLLVRVHPEIHKLRLKINKQKLYKNSKKYYCVWFLIPEQDLLVIILYIGWEFGL